MSASGFELVKEFRVGGDFRERRRVKMWRDLMGKGKEFCDLIRSTLERNSSVDKPQTSHLHIYKEKQILKLPQNSRLTSILIKYK